MKTSYECGVLDTKKWLTEEVAIVCRDYCIKLWGVAMDLAGVPTDSKLRRAENIFFPKDIREILESDPPSEQLPSFLMPKILRGQEWVRKLSLQ